MAIEKKSLTSNRTDRKKATVSKPKVEAAKVASTRLHATRTSTGTIKVGSG